jgi:UTP:GlnB (protein PII) uridylyltransferase
MGFVSLKYRARPSESTATPMRPDPAALDLPIADPAEVVAFLRTLPVALDRDHFAAFVLGFPRRYLAQTPRAEIVKHYALSETGAGKPVTSALSADGGHWKLCILCRERSRLFTRLAGALSARGMSIVDAEAFANERGMVFDMFRFADPSGRLHDAGSRRELQRWLESAATGGEREAAVAAIPAGVAVSLATDQDLHPTATWVRVQCADFPGLLHRVSSAFSDAGCNIEMAFVRTPGQRADDEFYLTRDGGKVDEPALEQIRAALAS